MLIVLPIVRIHFQEVFLVGWFILVAVYLASSGVPQYQVTLEKGETCPGKFSLRGVT